MNIIHAAQAGQGGAVSIACINKATVDLGVPFAKLTATLQKCFDQYFLPVWGYPVDAVQHQGGQADGLAVHLLRQCRRRRRARLSRSDREGPAAHEDLRQDHARGQAARQRHRLPRIVRDGHRSPSQISGRRRATARNTPMRCATPSRRTPSWSTGSRCPISCTRPGSSPSSTRPARNSITSACSRSPSP